MYSISLLPNPPIQEYTKVHLYIYIYREREFLFMIIDCNKFTLVLSYGRFWKKGDGVHASSMYI